MTIPPNVRAAHDRAEAIREQLRAPDMTPAKSKKLIAALADAYRDVHWEVKVSLASAPDTN